MPKSEFCFLYVPVRDSAEAEMIARTLLEEELVACANILPGMTSIYSWQGQVETQREALLILKTRTALTKEATERIEALHSYDTPCVATLPLEHLNTTFAEWITSETRAE